MVVWKTRSRMLGALLLARSMLFQLLRRKLGCTKTKFTMDQIENQQSSIEGRLRPRRTRASAQEAGPQTSLSRVNRLESSTRRFAASRPMRDLDTRRSSTAHLPWTATQLFVRTQTLALRPSHFRRSPTRLTSNCRDRATIGCSRAFGARISLSCRRYRRGLRDSSNG